MNFPVDSLEITVHELHDALKAGQKMTLIDVREDKERAIASLKEAKSISMNDLAIGLKAFDLSCSLVMLCHHGYRSLQATLYAKSIGFKDVRSVKGGIDAWSVTIDPQIPRY